MIANFYPASCYVDDCTDAGMGEDVWCEYCHSIFCRSHYDGAEHECRYTTERKYDGWLINIAFEALDEAAIIERASALRPGHRCTLVLPRKHSELPDDKWGGFNLCIDVPFDDGVTWVLKFPFYVEGLPPADFRRRTCESQVATYRALHACGMIVPQIYDWGIGGMSEHDAYQTTWILYEKMPGFRATEDPDPRIQRKYVEGWAAQAIKNSGLCFDKIGSLEYNAAGETVVGDFTDTRETLATSSPYHGGPFLTLKDRHTKHIDIILQAIEAGTKYRSCPLQAYLAHLWIRAIVSANEELGRQETEFYLKHADARERNFLATDEHELTAILDWEWAYTTTKADAFGAPMWLHFWTDEFEAGDNSLSSEELYLCEVYRRLGRPDLAECVEGARLYQRLYQLIDHPLRDAEQFLGRLRGLAEAANHHDDLPPFDNLDEWIKTMLVRYEGTDGLRGVVELDKTTKQTRQPRIPASDS